MVEVRTGVAEEDIRRDAKHALFVEGKDKNAIDPTVLRSLLPSSVRILALGPSFYVRSVAEALYRHHPFYYFLIDRDHYDDSFVEECWRTFPNPNTANLLVWHRRELENYFLVPEYLSKSEYLAPSVGELRKCILDCSRKRVYLDAANQVIVSIREEMKRSDIPLFPSIHGFASAKEAFERLKNLPQWRQRDKAIGNLLGKREIKKRFSEVLFRLTGDRMPIEFGFGRWLELLKGKEILPTVINRCFSVRDQQGRALQGRDRLMEVIKDLLRKDIAEQPDDFKRLHDVISRRLEAAV